MPIAPSPAVLRAGDILKHLIQHPTDAFSVSELARIVDVPRATCDAILQALAAHQIVSRRAQDRCYELGPGSITLGDAARIAHPALRAAGREGDALARELKSCVAVCVRDGGVARVVEVFDFGPLFALRARVGQAIPLIPPFGAVFVAWSRADAVAWLEAPDAMLQEEERQRYRRALEEVRARGFSVAIAPARQSALPKAIETLAGPEGVGEAHASRSAALAQVAHSDYLLSNLETNAPVRFLQISAPIFDREGKVSVSLLMSGPDHDVSIAELRAIADRVVRAATNATHATGGRPPA